MPGPAFCSIKRPYYVDQANLVIRDEAIPILVKRRGPDFLSDDQIIIRGCEFALLAATGLCAKLFESR